MVAVVLDSIEFLSGEQQARLAVLHEVVAVANDLHITAEHDPVSSAFDLAVLANFVLTGRETFPDPQAD